MSAPIKDGSQDPQNKKPIENKQMSLNEEDFDVKDVEIHTMKSDLADLKNPPKKKIAIKSEDIEKKPTPKKENGPFFQKEILQEKEEIKKSETLNQPKPFKIDSFKPPVAPEPIKQNVKEKIMEEKIEPAKPIQKEVKMNELEIKENTTKKEEPAPESDGIITGTLDGKNDSDTESHGIGKAIIIAVIISVIIIVGAGGYYFWMTRVSTTPQAIPSDIAITETSSQSEPAEEVLPELSNQNSNYLMLDLTNIDAIAIKNVLDDYSNKVSKTNTVGLYEFLITDENNTPIKFEDFASMLGLAIPADILSEIGPDFSLYIYNYGDKTRFGLSISIKDSVQTALVLSKNETALIQGLSALYSDSSYSAPTVSFSDAKYDNAPTASIRYVNITNSEDMTLDYSVLNNQLVFGTTKTITYSILDRLVQEDLNTKQTQKE